MKEVFIAGLDGHSDNEIKSAKSELLKRSRGSKIGKEVKNVGFNPNPAYSKVIYSKTGNIEENYGLLHERDFDGTGTKTKGTTLIELENNQFIETHILKNFNDDIQATDSKESSELKRGRAEPSG